MVDIAANTTSTATFEGSVAVMATFSGDLETFGDKDWIKVTLQAGGVYQFFACADSGGPNGGNSKITLRDANGVAIPTMSNDNDPGPTGTSATNSYLNYAATTTGTYFLEVGSVEDRACAYSLVVMYNEPRYRLSPSDDPYSGAVPAVIVGDKGDDVINLASAGISALGEQGNDNIEGNAGDNRLSGGLGNDELYGVDGNDRLFGDAGFDWLEGHAGDDLLYGGLGADELRGGSGNDILFTGEGADSSKGGPGNDAFHVESPNDLVFEAAGEGTDTIFTTVSYALLAGQAIEFLQAEVPGSTAPLNLTGNTLNNTIVGNNGANVLTGGGGADTLRGLLGNDVYMLSDAQSFIADTGGVDTIVSPVGPDLRPFATIENATISGAASVNAIGNNLANVITGNGGSNPLDGGFGNDVLRGMAGNDFIYGNVGRDVMTGGIGNDLFRYATIGQSPVGANADVITDFDDFGDDRIDLSAIFGGTLAYRHNLAFTAIGQVRINDIAGADLIVEVNTVGGLGADMQIRLTGTSLAAMAANDFIL
jgi:Ca2+-binding RTX toxin-like protein